MTTYNYRISMQQRYFCLCLSQIYNYEEVKLKVQTLKVNSMHEEDYIVEMNLVAANEALEQAAVAPTISAAMALEAFSYDYAAENLSDSFVKKHLDKLDIPSRIVITSKLITGKEFAVDSLAYSKIKSLIKTRNKLIHFKSRRFTSLEADKAQKFRESLGTELEQAMYNGRDALRLLMKELDHMHGYEGVYEYSIEPTQCHA